MIIITLSYDIDNPRGGRPVTRVIRKAFADDAVELVNEFLNTEPDKEGWYNRNYKYTKL